MATITATNLIEVVDSNNFLTIQCATIQNRYESSPNTRNTEEKHIVDLKEEYELRKVRGTIVDNKTKKIIVEGSFFPYEFTESESDKFEEYLSVLELEFKDMEAGYSYEGTVIRIFYHDKWYVSTHRKLDANKSKWGSDVSFRTLFENALIESYNLPLKDLLTTLNLRCQYTFMLLADENTKFACEVNPNFKKVYLLETNDLENQIAINRLPKPKVTFADVKEAFDYVKTESMFQYPFTYQGLLLTHKNGSQYRIVTNEYAHYFKVRDNQQSIPFRYLQLKSQNNRQDIELLGKLFPKYVPIFKMYDAYIDEIATIIYQNYCKRRQGEMLTIPQPFYLFIKNHLMNKTSVDVDLITQLILEQPSPVINGMIKVVKFNNKKVEYERKLIIKMEEVLTPVSDSPTNAPKKKKRVKYTNIPIEFSCRKKLF
ncbi:hypothetical protein DH26_gp105 [Chloriridovirus anopheles1]|uniref:Uncharacterized protein n=1 Tax=Chloriridovirus anopheles1 TaxID=1465751 RepID=W8QN31_9VIRU|nr:hypothetical protein DH26_gp105 [Anopheles minimus iridovirus]AHL67598.1 hypothetical protein AMIV_105 [Anopheles minimus iridovirus]